MNYFKQSYVVIFCLYFLPSFGFSQYTICGKTYLDKEIQSNILVQVLGKDKQIVSNEDGTFCLDNLEEGVYHLLANSYGYKSDTITVKLNENIKNLQIGITTEFLNLDGVDVVSEKLTDKKASESIKAEIIDLTQHQRSSESVEQLMNSTAGIKVRSEGALGDDAKINVGGFYGKSVRFLIDGIPIDYLGSSMGISKIPTNMAHHIEIYKGVLPTEIGIDALGAAVNIVTQQPSNTGHRVSYEVGSYNTHRLSINSFVRASEKFSFGVDAFASYARNNYEVDDLPYENQETGKNEFITTKLFHNGYQQFSGNIFIDFENRKWADLFKITLNSYALKRELQNDFTSRSRPFGQAHRKEHAYAIPSIHYKKNLFNNKLSLDQFLVFSHINYALVDSVKNGYYDWLGERHDAVSGSEMGTDLSYLAEPIIRTAVNNLSYRGLFTFRLHKNHKIVLNLIDNFLYRIADNLGQYDSQTHITYNRFIAGLGYQYNLFNQKVEGITQIKYLGSQTQGEVTDMLYVGKSEGVEMGNKFALNNGVSFAQSLKYNLKENWIFRASLENTYRLPDQSEIFGDNVFIKPHLTLKPEKSFNVNASIRYKNRKWFAAEISSYYRNTKDMVRLKDLTQFSAIYLNLDHVKGYGIEFEASIYPFEGFELSGNITYNEFRYQGTNDEFAMNQHFIDARVSNMPFYFGNARISYQFKKLFSPKVKMNIYYTYNYMHQYYLDYIERQFEPDGFLGLFGESKVYTDRVIPIQHIHSAGMVWWIDLPRNQELSLGVEARNIFDAKIYNNFRIQSMGRSFSAKISYGF